MPSLSDIRGSAGAKAVCTILLLLIVRPAGVATDPQMVEPGYYLEQISQPSLVVPNHLAVSPSWIIVVTEWSNQERVARLHEDGSVSTYAQPSSGHHFDVALDAASNLYVGDGPDSLWRVSAGGEVSLIARDVYGCSLDIGPSGDVYAAGSGNSFVQRVTPSGDVSVYADGFVRATAVAVCPINEDVFVFDMLAGTIWRAVPGGAPIPLSTGLVHEVSGIDVAPDGTLYYAAMGHLYTVSRADGERTELAWVRDVCGNLGTGDFDSAGRLIAGGTSSILRVDLVEETAEVLWRSYGHSEALGVAPGPGAAEIFVGSSSPLPTLPGSVGRIESEEEVTLFVDGLLAEVCGFVATTPELGYVVSSQFSGGGCTCIVDEVDMASGAQTEHATMSTHGRKLVIDPVTGRLWGLFDGISYFDEAGGRHVLNHASTGIVQLESIAFTPDGTLYITGYTTDIMGMPVEGALYRIDDQYGPAPSYVPIADLSTVEMCCPLGSIAGGTDGNVYWVGHGDRYTPGSGREMHMLRIARGGEVTLIGHQFPVDPFAITDLGGIEHCTDLKQLSLRNNGIADVGALAGLGQLEKLWLESISINDVAALAGLDSLVWLFLGDNDIESIDPLSGLTSLEELELYGNQISDIAPLAGLANLSALGLNDNPIGSIGPLSGLAQLEVSWLDGLQLDDLSPLSSPEGLRELYLTSIGLQT